MENNEFLYLLKDSMITKTERSYLSIIKRSLPNGYFVQPQVNLASVITKQKAFNKQYQNELFRNIDACIFDMSYKPIVLVEFNGESNMSHNAVERDLKVESICKEGGTACCSLG